MANTTPAKQRSHVHRDAPWFSPVEAADRAQRERNRRRADGWIIAAISAIVLWLGIGLGVWAIMRAFN